MSASTTTPPSTNVASMPKRSHHAPLSKTTTLSEAFEHPEFMSRIKQAIPRHMTPERMLSVFIQAVKKTPKLREVDTMSLLGAFVSVASVGLEPNTALQHAHIIPFAKNKWNPSTRQYEQVGVEVNIIFGYQGLLELVYRSGLMRSVHADVVWKDEDNDDHFRFHYGSGSELFHKPLGGQHGPEEMPAWAYTHANMKGDAEMFEVMPMASILRIRDASQGYASAVASHDRANEKGWKPPASYTEAPWVKHFIPMAKKTAFRAAAKWLPKSIELASAINLDEAQERGRIPYENVIEGTASILDGGLDAITDEYTDRVEVDVGAGFSMQDSRQTVPAERASDTPSQQTAQTAQTAQAAETGFSAYLLDQWGEMVDDEFTDAMSYATALRTLAGKAENLQAFLEANAAGMEDAEKVNSVARNIIRSIVVETQQVERSSQPIPLTQNGRGAAWPPYVKAVKEALATITAALLPAWAEMNLPTILQAPDPQRLLIVKAVSDRATILGCAVPEGVANAIVKAAATTSAPIQAASTESDQDSKWAHQTVEDIKKLPSIATLREFTSSTAIRTKLDRFREQRPELFKLIDDAGSAVMQAFGPPSEPHHADGLDATDSDFPGDRP
jgi:recombination protein RecT